EDAADGAVDARRAGNELRSREVDRERGRIGGGSQHGTRVAAPLLRVVLVKQLADRLANDAGAVERGGRRPGDALLGEPGPEPVVPALAVDRVDEALHEPQRFGRGVRNVVTWWLPCHRLRHQSRLFAGYAPSPLPDPARGRRADGGRCTTARPAGPGARRRRWNRRGRGHARGRD